MEDIFITLRRNGTSWGRKLNVPTEYSIAGVEHDKNARCFRFKLPKLPEFQDLVDLSGLSCRVNYQHEYFDYAFTTDLFRESNKTITDESGEEYLIFRWVLGEECFPTSGKLSFILCCSFRGEQDDILKEWNSEIATVEVKKGLELDNEIIFQKDISADGWATTRRIADGAVTLDKLAQEVKDEFLDLDTKIANETTKAENDNKNLETKLNKKIEDDVQEVFDGKVVSAEKFSGKCTNSGIEVMHITGKTEQERTNGHQLFDIYSVKKDSGGEVVNKNGIKMYFNPDNSISAFGTSSVGAFGFYTRYNTDKIKGLFRRGSVRFNPNSINTVPYAYINNYIGTEENPVKTPVFEVNTNDGTKKEGTFTEDYLSNQIVNSNVGFYVYQKDTINARSFKPMLYQDGDGTYETFTGGKPGPNPEYPLPLKSFETNKVVCMGKNVAVVSDMAYRNDCTADMLTDGTMVFKSTGTTPYVGNVGGYRSYGEGEPVSSNTNTLIPVPTGATIVYTKSFDGVINKIIIHMFDKWRHSLGYEWRNTNASSIPLKEDTAYISVSFQMMSYTGVTAGQTYTDKVMVSFEPITEYVPPFYKEITLPETLTLRSLPDGTCDEYLGDGKILRRVLKLTCNNVNDIEDIGGYVSAGKYGGKNVFRIRTLGYTDHLNWTDKEIPCIWCNYFVPITINQGVNTTTPKNGISCSKTSGKIYFTTDDITSLDDFSVKLANKPLEILMPIKEPTIEEYSMPILPAVDDDVRAFFVSDTDTDIIWRPCPVSDDKLRIQELNTELTSLKKTVDDILNHRTNVLVEEE